MPDFIELKRGISLPLLIFYGLGNILHFRLSLDAGARQDVSSVKEAPTYEIDEMQENKTETRLQGKVLLVEDNPANQKLITLHLHRLGVLVDIAENGKIGCERAMNDSYDLLLMDMQMPEMDGMEATRYLRDHGYHGPIVALSANVLKKDVDLCFEAGCDDFLGKPLEREKFINVLSRYLKRSAGDIEVNSDPVYSNLLDEEPDLEDLVEIFLDKFPGMLAELRADFEQQNWPDMKKKAHDLKAIGGGYGFPLVTQLAEKLEFEITRQNRDGMDRFLNELDTTQKRLKPGCKVARKSTRS